ncbi:hypothetical protein WJ977_18135 [Achromobacter xylosoxidans]
MPIQDQTAPAILPIWVTAVRPIEVILPNTPATKLLVTVQARLTKPPIRPGNDAS